MAEMQNILLIGGTQEAVQINAILFSMRDISLTTSLAGRTENPAALKGNVISGGFTERGGLKAYLIRHRIDLVIDASHPFAAVISETAHRVCEHIRIPYVRFDRRPWTRKSLDNWIVVETITDAANQAAAFTRIFLTVGRQELAAFEYLSNKEFLVRSIEDIQFSPKNSSVDHIRARGPFTLQDELTLMKSQGTEVVISKNSGGDATFAKIAAARSLSLPVIMINRPPTDSANIVRDIDDLLRVINTDKHQ